MGTLWMGQHNVEYFGEQEYMMFDNAYDPTTDTFVGDSRLLVVRVDEEASTATLVWEYKLGYNSSVFGDNDRLPTGNLLASGWPAKPTATVNYDAQIVEVVRGTGEVAWSAEVY